MCRHLLRVLISVVTLTIGVAIAPIRFNTEMWGHGVVSDGGGAFAVVRYISSYFVTLWRTSEGYDTPEKADQVFRGRLKKAVKVLERTPKFSGGGAKVGERAVAIFYNRESGKPYACVFWTEGPVLTQVYSPSLMHVLDFEKHQDDY